MNENLVIVPVYNEAATLVPVVKCLSRNYAGTVLFVDDGSSDETPALLKEAENAGPIIGLRVTVITHAENKGYGSSLIDGFDFARKHGFRAVLTMDCDWQHQPSFIGTFFNALPDYDVISGSRYLGAFDCDAPAPPERRALNRLITNAVNNLTGFTLTDSFCGFKAYQTAALARLQLDEPGYGMPLQFWIQARHFGLRIKELPVPRIYQARFRSFGSELNDPERRLAYYRSIIDREKRRWGMGRAGEETGKEGWL